MKLSGGIWPYYRWMPVPWAARVLLMLLFYQLPTVSPTSPVPARNTTRSARLAAGTHMVAADDPQLVMAAIRCTVKAPSALKPARR